MRSTLRLRFHSRLGQELFVTGDHELLGSGRLSRALPMHYLDPEHWQVVVWVPDSIREAATFSYHYVLREPDGTYVHDAERDRMISFGPSGGDLIARSMPGYQVPTSMSPSTQSLSATCSSALQREKWPDRQIPTRPMYSRSRRLCCLRLRPCASSDRALGWASGKRNVQC